MLLWLTPPSGSGGTGTHTSLVFFDETGQNPLPPAILVAVTDFSGNSLGQAYTTPGGFVAITVQSGTSYIATLTGTQVRGVPKQAFTASATSPTKIIVANYRSPCLASFGYTQEQMEALPTDDFPPSAKSTGGIAYAIGSGFSGALAAIDYEQQLVLGAARLVSSTGLALDSWANDFIGPGVWSRGPQEGDVAYLARIILWLQTRKGTLQGIQTLLQAYIIGQADPAALTGSMALDTSGALDEVGALDGASLASAAFASALPTVTCFDYQSDFQLSQLVGLTQDAGQFAILLTFPNKSQQTQWFAGFSFAGVNTFAADPQYTQLTSVPSGIQDLVKTIKILGTLPVYFTN